MTHQQWRDMRLRQIIQTINLAVLITLLPLWILLMKLNFKLNTSTLVIVIVIMYCLEMMHFFLDWVCCLERSEYGCHRKIKLLTMKRLFHFAIVWSLGIKKKTGKMRSRSPFIYNIFLLGIVCLKGNSYDFINLSRFCP